MADDRAVIGCVHAAWKHLADTGHPCPYADVEATWRAEQHALAPLLGTDAVWRRLAAAHLDRVRREPTLF